MLRVAVRLLRVAVRLHRVAVRLLRVAVRLLRVAVRLLRVAVRLLKVARGGFLLYGISFRLISLISEYLSPAPRKGTHRVFAGVKCCSCHVIVVDEKSGAVQIDTDFNCRRCCRCIHGRDHVPIDKQ